MAEAMQAAHARLEAARTLLAEVEREDTGYGPGLRAVFRPTELTHEWWLLLAKLEEKES